MGIPVHRFPKMEELLFKWIEATKVTCVSTHTIICGFHFETTCYKNPNAERRTLKKNSVPTLNLPVDPGSHSNHEDNTNQDQNMSIDSEGFCECEHDIDMFDAPVEETDDFTKLEGIEKNSNVVHVFKDKLYENIPNYADKATQTDMEKIEDQLSQVSINQSVQTERFGFLNLFKKDSDPKAFTGIDFSLLEALEKSIRLIKNFDKDQRVCSLKERIILVLCKLKLCLSYDCLGVLFNISRTTANKYFIETIHLLASVLEEAVYFPTKKGIRENIPEHFKEFTKTRIDLDCTEIAVESSRYLRCKLKMYSHYKAKQTLKVMVGTTPSGLISFCSKCYGGRASDKVMFLSSQLLEKLTTYDDAVMTDKGFLIKEDCEKSNVTLIRPPFANQSEQMSEEDTIKTNKIAAARVHIERTIERMKNFAILKSTINWEMTKYMDEIMIIIFGLVNLSPPILDNYHISAEKNKA